MIVIGDSTKLLAPTLDYKTAQRTTEGAGILRHPLALFSRYDMYYIFAKWNNGMCHISLLANCKGSCTNGRLWTGRDSG